MPAPALLSLSPRHVANGSVRCGPNSATAIASSLSLVRTALSTSTTIALDRSSSASMGTPASARGSVGSTRLAASNSAARRLRRRRRVDHHSSSPATATTASTTTMRKRRHVQRLRRVDVEALGGGDSGARPVLAAQHRLDLVALQPIGVGLADHGGRHKECVGAFDDRDGQQRVVVAEVADLGCRVGPADRILAEPVDVDHPQPGAAGVVEPSTAACTSARWAPSSAPALSVT